MNTTSIIISVLAVCYSIIVGWTAKAYKHEINREYKEKQEIQSIKSIVQGVQIEMLNEKLAWEKKVLKAYIDSSKAKIKRLEDTIKELTPTEPDGN